MNGNPMLKMYKMKNGDYAKQDESNNTRAAFIHITKADKVSKLTESLVQMKMSTINFLLFGTNYT